MRNLILSKISTFCVLALANPITSFSVQSLLREPSGCGKEYEPYQDGESRTFNISSSGGLRSFNIHLPLNYDPDVQYPLMISYHGGTETMEVQEEISQFSYNSTNPSMIAVYPQGIKVCLRAHQWIGFSHPSKERNTIIV